MRPSHGFLFAVITALTSVGCGHTGALASKPSEAPHATSACSGLDEAALARPLFEEATDVRRLTAYVGKQRREVTRGVSFRVPAHRGESAEYLERVISCRITRADSGPLAVEGVRSHVLTAHGAYEVRLTSADPAKGREVARLAASVVAPSPSDTVASR